MGIFFVYILKSSVCLTIFYLFYKLLLSRDTFHRFNRIALLSLIMLSVIIPFCEITLEEATAIQRPVMDLENLLAAVSMRTSAESASQPVWLRVMVIAYIIGGILTLCQFAYSFYALFRLMRQGTPKLVDGIHLILTDQPVVPFSWMRTIVISRKDFEESGIEIMTHEMAHIKARHSIDLLISEICILFHWFNPSVWLLRQELQNIHEYEADESVLNQGVDAKRYQLLLIKKAVGAQRFTSMANSFNHSSLKKRITMMLKKKSNPWARLKYLYVLPLAAIAVAAFARPEISSELDEISAVKVNDLTAIMKTEEVKSTENHPAKEIKVQGQVLEKGTNRPIVGANVIVKGTTSGTITDLDGNFVISMPAGATLRISYIDVKTEELVVTEDLIAEKKTLKVYLQGEGQVGKDEVVVVGYGAMEASDANPVFQVVEVMPEFPGGMAECLKFLGKNIKYPVQSQQAGVQGKVIVQFVVEKDGSVSNPKVVRSIDPDLDGEAVRVISIMPKWKPGMQKGQAVRVKYTVPVTFRLDRPAGADDTHRIVLKMDSAAMRNNSVHFYKGSLSLEDVKDKPLLIIDGNKVPYEQMGKMDASTIESISILKDSEAVKLYESEGKNGVILITTKKQK